MKTLFKALFVFLMSFVFVQSSEAHGRYYEHCEHRGYYGGGYYGVRYYGPRYVPVAPCYHREYAPGYYFVNRWGRREFVHPYYR